MSINKLSQTDTSSHEEAIDNFIVWDNDEQAFVDMANKSLCFGYDDFEWVLLNEYNEQLIANYSGIIFRSIGKEDIDNKKIYEQCSIVRFNILDSVYHGFFKYNKDKLYYEIHTSNWIIRYDDGMANIKVVDTIQENRLGLVE